MTRRDPDIVARSKLRDAVSDNPRASRPVIAEVGGCIVAAGRDDQGPWLRVLSEPTRGAVGPLVNEVLGGETVETVEEQTLYRRRS